MAPAPRPRWHRARLFAGCLALACSAHAPIAAADAPPVYVDELIARADALQLDADPQWRALVHYEPRRWSPAVESTADSEWFFLAPNGRADPRAELHATLRRFAAPDAPMTDGEPPQCALRGRYLWLDRRLAFDRRQMPAQACVEYDAWRAGLQARGVTLIFPEAYLNNPSSMFGHVLLRLDAGPPEDRQDLLAYGVNFSADTGADGGVTFAWKGILGYYPGRFAVEPYYDIVKRYGDWESRDIWEYELALDPAALDLLLAHLWELRGVEFAYYFFDANCAYQILALLDAAQPELRLRAQFGAWVIPAETVRAVAAQPGLVRGRAYRPSAGTALHHAARQLPPAERALASAVADGRVEPDAPALAPLGDRERAAVLGTAYDLFRRRYLVDREATDDERSRARAMLSARSRVPVEGSPLAPVPTPEVPPDRGHLSHRASAGVGVRDGQFYLESGLRLAYHDLIDPAGGYTAGAQIDVGDLVVRYYTKAREARVHRFTLVDIVSLAPIDAFAHPVSWRVDTGLFSRLVPQGPSNDLEEAYVWRSHGGAGLTIEPWAGGLAYGFVDATVDYGPALDDDHAIGPGATVGLFVGPPSERWRLHLFASVTRFALGDVSTASAVALAGRLTLTRQVAVAASLSGNRDFDRNWLESGLSVLVYF